MLLQAIATEIELQKDPLKLHQAILEQLEHHGHPLRWAITQVNSQTQTVTVEAIVTQYRSVKENYSPGRAGEAEGAEGAGEGKPC